MYGGAALNAAHALVADDLGPDRPRRPARRVAPARRRAARPRRSSPAGGSSPPATTSSTSQGARPADPRAAEEFYLRTFAEPALDVNGFESGSPHLQKTVLPVEAVANLSIRLAPGPAGRGDRRRARAAAPRGGAGRGDDRDRALVVVAARARVARREGRAARARCLRAVARCPAGADPLGRHPADRPGARRQGQIPTIITGFGLPDSNIHSPNERLARRVRAARDRDRARALPRAGRAVSEERVAAPCLLVALSVLGRRCRCAPLTRARPLRSASGTLPSQSWHARATSPAPPVGRIALEGGGSAPHPGWGRQPEPVDPRSAQPRRRSVPGRRVVHPAAGDHRRDDLGVEVVPRVAVEHDEVGGAGRGSAGRASARRRRARPARGSSPRTPAGPSAPAPDARRRASSIVRRTPARIPASGSSSSIGASEPFATTAPESSSER